MIATTKQKSAVVSGPSNINPAALSLPPTYTIRLELKPKQPSSAAQPTEIADGAFMVN